MIEITAASPVFGAEKSDTVKTLDEVVVTGSNDPVRLDLLPYTVSVIGEKQLQSAGNTRILSILSGQVPGLFVTERGIFGYGVSNGGSGHIKLRGVGGDRASSVLMMIDGQPQFAGIYSHHIGDFYSKVYVERVEVLRGPASVLYGSNAMAGTINVITRGARRDGVHTSLQSQFGSYNTWLTTLDNTVRYGRFSSLVSASYDRTDGSIDGMDFKQWSGYAKAGWDFSDSWKAYADLTLMNYKAHDPVYATLSNPESTDVYFQDITRGETAVTVSDNYRNVSGTARVYYSWGNHYIDDPRHFHSVDDRLGAILYQNFRPWENTSVTLGFDFDRYTGKIPVSGGTTLAPGNKQTLSRKHITEYSPYITAMQTLFSSRLTLDAGLRVACSDMFSTQVVPQGGFSVRIPADVVLKGNVAMGYRNPSFRELYLYRMANPDLKPEKMVNYEAEVAKAFNRYFSASVTFYYSRGTEMIQVVDMKNVNTGRFYNKGVEVSLSSNPLDNLNLHASYSYLHTSLHNLTGAPRHQYYLGADWQPISWLDVAADLRGVGCLYVAEGIKHQNYALLNLKATARVWKHLDIFVRLENITDARYTVVRGYQMPGFTAMGGFRLHF